MLLQSIIGIALLFGRLTTAQAVGDEEYRPCGAEPEEQHLENARMMGLEEQAARAQGEPDAKATITVDTAFHVVAISHKKSEGYLSDEQLKQQLNIINREYKPHGIHFNLINISRTINKDWAQDKKRNEKRRAIRQGDYKTLNVYFQHRLDFREDGICYFPEDVEPNSNKFWRDGCTVKYSTLPGYSQKYQGITLVHEIGHWFNLFHTFQGGCTKPGDHIADTPAQAEALWRCQVGVNSCPQMPGKDPVHNFMGYSAEYVPMFIPVAGGWIRTRLTVSSSCRTKFTPDQQTRMHSAWKKFRLGQ